MKIMNYLKNLIIKQKKIFLIKQIIIIIMRVKREKTTRTYHPMSRTTDNISKGV